VLASVTANNSPAVAETIAKPVSPNISHSKRIFRRFGDFREIGFNLPA
jgi:hypothetical protein